MNKSEYINYNFLLFQGEVWEMLMWDYLHLPNYANFHFLVWHSSVPYIWMCVRVCVGTCAPRPPPSSVIWRCRGSAPRAVWRGRSFWTPQPMGGWRETSPCWRWRTRSRESFTRRRASSRTPSADTRCYSLTLFIKHSTTAPADHSAGQSTLR